MVDNDYTNIDSDFLPFEGAEIVTDDSGFELIDEKELEEDGLLHTHSDFRKPMSNSKGYITPGQTRTIINYFKDEANKHPVNYTLNRCNKYRLNITKGLIVFVLWYSGRRVSEVVGIPPYDRCPGLRPYDINFKDKLVTFSILKKNAVLKIRKGKKRTQEAIKRDYAHKEIHLEQKPLPSLFFPVLKHWIDKFNITPHERIFPYGRHFVNKLLRESSKELELKLPGHRYFRAKGSPTQRVKKPATITPHSLRHGYAINFLNVNKTNPKALPILQLLLSHEDINTTKEYTRFQIGDMTELVENLNMEDKRK